MSLFLIDNNHYCVELFSQIPHPHLLKSANLSEPSTAGMLFVFKDRSLENDNELYEIYCNDRHIDGRDVRADVSEYIRVGPRPVQ